MEHEFENLTTDQERLCRMFLTLDEMGECCGCSRGFETAEALLREAGLMATYIRDDRETEDGLRIFGHHYRFTVI